MRPCAAPMVHHIQIQGKSSRKAPPPPLPLRASIFPSEMGDSWKKSVGIGTFSSSDWGRGKKGGREGGLRRRTHDDVQKQRLMGRTRGGGRGEEGRTGGEWWGRQGRGGRGGAGREGPSGGGRHNPPSPLQGQVVQQQSHGSAPMTMHSLRPQQDHMAMLGSAAALTNISGGAQMQLRSYPCLQPWSGDGSKPCLTRSMGGGAATMLLPGGPPRTLAQGGQSALAVPPGWVPETTGDEVVVGRWVR